MAEDTAKKKNKRISIGAASSLFGEGNDDDVFSTLSPPIGNKATTNANAQLNMSSIAEESEHTNQDASNLFGEAADNSFYDQSLNYGHAASAEEPAAIPQTNATATATATTTATDDLGYGYGYEQPQQQQYDQQYDSQHYDPSQQYHGQYYDQSQYAASQEPYDPATQHYAQPQHGDSQQYYAQPEQHFDPSQQYNSSQQYDPSQQYDQSQQYYSTSEQPHYDPSQQYDPSHQYDPSQAYDQSQYSYDQGYTYDQSHYSQESYDPNMQGYYPPQQGQEAAYQYDHTTTEITNQTPCSHDAESHPAVADHAADPADPSLPTYSLEQGEPIPQEHHSPPLETIADYQQAIAAKDPSAVSETTALAEVTEAPPLLSTATAGDTEAPTLPATVDHTGEREAPTLPPTVALSGESEAPTLPSIIALEGESEAPNLPAKVALGEGEAPTLPLTIALEGVSEAPTLPATVALEGVSEAPTLPATVALEGSSEAAIAPPTIAMDGANESEIPPLSENIPTPAQKEIPSNSHASAEIQTNTDDVSRSSPVPPTTGVKLDEVDTSLATTFEQVSLDKANEASIAHAEATTTEHYQPVDMTQEAYGFENSNFKADEQPSITHHGGEQQAYADEAYPQSYGYEGYGQEGYGFDVTEAYGHDTSSHAQDASAAYAHDASAGYEHNASAPYSQDASAGYGYDASAGYGQDTTAAYGQDASAVYGQDASTYGQETSPYGQEASTYGQEASTYGQEASTYGQDAYATYGQEAGLEPPTSYEQDPAASYGHDAATSYDVDASTLEMDASATNGQTADPTYATAETGLPSTNYGQPYSSLNRSATHSSMDAHQGYAQDHSSGYGYEGYGPDKAAQQPTKAASTGGATLVPAAAGTAPNTITCPECHTDNKPSAKFCMECGYRLAALSRSTTPATATYGAAGAGPGFDAYRKTASASPFSYAGNVNGISNTMDQANGYGGYGSSYDAYGSSYDPSYSHSRKASVQDYAPHSRQQSNNSYGYGSSTSFGAPQATINPAEDPLGRIGANVLKPVVSFGFGGRLLVMFPQTVQRYTSDAGFGAAPVTKTNPGVVSIRKVTDAIPVDKFGIDPSFPGPVLLPEGGRSGQKKRKAESTKWIDDKVALLSPSIGVLPEGSFERQQMTDHVLLWKLLKLMIEHDGKLDGNTQLDDAIRKLLVPSLAEASDDSANFVSTEQLQQPTSTASSEPQITYTVTASSVDAVSALLLKGDRDGAVRYAVSERMWPHALLIASSMTKDIWSDVVGDFIRHELGSASASPTLGVATNNTQLSGREPLRVLYALFAGKMHFAAQEFLPHASSFNPTAFPPPLAPTTPGYPMKTPGSAAFPASVAGLGILPNNPANPDTLGRWRETVAMILANRTAGDLLALTALGDTLAANGWVYAAHICYILSPQTSVQSGMDTPGARLVLLGADHPFNAHRDVQALSASEIYEFALGLKAGGEFSAQPHLQAYKLVHAWLYADAGLVGDASRYCETIISTMRQYNKGSPYFHGVLLSAVREFQERLGQAPSDVAADAGSWIPKKLPRPAFDSLWGSLENKFNKFVAGDGVEDASAAGTAPPKGGEIGPFSHYSAISPESTSGTLSRNLSSNDLRTQATLTAATRTFESSGSTLRPPSAASMSSPNPQYQSQFGGYTGYTPVQEQGEFTQSYGQDQLQYGQDQPQYGQEQQQYEQEQPQYGQTSGYEAEQPGQTETSGPDYGYGASQGASGQTPTFYSADVSSGSGYEPYVPQFDAPVPAETASHHSKGDYGDDFEDDLGLSTKPSKKQMPEAVDGQDDDKPKSKQDAAAAAFAAAAAAEAKAAEEKAAAEKKAGWLGGWFKKKDQQQPGPIKAKLGEQTSFVFDKDLGRWVNKKGGEDTTALLKPPPPPSRAVTASPSAMAGKSSGGSAAPPRGSSHMRSGSTVDAPKSGPPMSRTTSTPGLAPPSSGRRPASTTGKRPLKNRYVDIMNTPQ